MFDLNTRLARHPACQLAAGFLALVVVFGTALWPAPATSKELCRNFRDHPQTLAGLEFSSTERYEDPGAGVYIKYGASQQILSIFKYDDGLASISDDDLQSARKSSVSAITGAVETRGDKVVSWGEEISWQVGSATFHGTSLRAGYKEYGVEAFEFVGLSHNSACMLKVRYTDASDNDPAQSLARYRSYVLEAHALFR